MNYRDLDQIFMGLAIEEAKKGFGHANPNPFVGSVIVKNGEVIGIGHHQKYGSHHAEVNAINDAKEKGHDLTGSTIYVNLEPCSHTKKQTPPCAPRLVAEKFSKVVIANIDPNPHVDGGGIKLLQDNGIEVVTGVLKEEGEKLNEIFFKAMRKKMPFVHLKMGQTLDGKVATSNFESKYITGPESRKYVHELRQIYDVICVGKATVLKDNPELTVRLDDIATKHPLRAIFIDLKSIDFSLKVFSDEYKKNSMVITTAKDAEHNYSVIQKLESIGIGVLTLDEDKNGRVDLHSFLRTMYSLKFYSILVEGGPTLASQFLKEDLVDKISIITAPYLLGDGKSTLNDIGISELANKKEVMNPIYKNLGKDFLVEGYLCSQD